MIVLLTTIGSLRCKIILMKLLHLILLTTVSVMFYLTTKLLKIFSFLGKITNECVAVL